MDNKVQDVAIDVYRLSVTVHCSRYLRTENDLSLANRRRDWLFFPPLRILTRIPRMLRGNNCFAFCWEKKSDISIFFSCSNKILTSIHIYDMTNIICFQSHYSLNGTVLFVHFWRVVVVMKSLSQTYSYWNVVCVGSLQYSSSHSQNTCKLGVRLTAYSKLSLGVNVSVDGCLFLYVCPAMNWRLVQGSVYRRPTGSSNHRLSPLTSCIYSFDILSA